MLCRSPATSTHPHSVPSIQGQAGCPSYRLQGKRQLQSFILMSLLSKVMTRTKQETRSFTVKTQLPGLGPRGRFLSTAAAPSYCCWRAAEALMEQKDSAPSSFSYLSLILLRACPELSFSKRRAVIWTLAAVMGSSRLSVSGLYPDLGSPFSSPSHHSQANVEAVIALATGPGA